MKRAAAALRHAAERSARRSSPPLERFKVLRKNPLLLEAYASGQKLSEGDSDLEIARGLRRLVSAGDDVMVGTERDGDRVVVAIAGADDDAEPADALSSPDESAVANEYGETEADVLRNVRTRLNELESRLQELGMLS